MVTCIMDRPRFDLRDAGKQRIRVTLNSNPKITLRDKKRREFRRARRPERVRFFSFAVR